MKIKNIILPFCAIVAVSFYLNGSNFNPHHAKNLKDIVGKKFLIGVAVNEGQVNGYDSGAINIIKNQYNAIVPENCMKSAEIHPKEDQYNFESADQFVRFGEKNKLTLTGHCLIWHSQLPYWFCRDKNGNLVSPEVLKQRMKKHIFTIIGRYKGKIKGWDVVNEAIESDGSWRKSPFYQILKEKYILLAFQYAHEADPDAELYYNDYGMEGKKKRNKVIQLIKSLKKKGLRIDAIGEQGHMGMDYPDYNALKKSIESFGKTGVKVMITEWDMSALPTVKMTANISDTISFKRDLNPYPNGLPKKVSEKWNTRMEKFFKLFMKESRIISRVTVWGVTDGDSWKNDFPVRGRIDYPVLFDRNYHPKPFLTNMIKQFNK